MGPLFSLHPHTATLHPESPSTFSWCQIMAADRYFSQGDSLGRRGLPRCQGPEEAHNLSCSGHKWTKAQPSGLGKVGADQNSRVMPVTSPQQYSNKCFFSEWCKILNWEPETSWIIKSRSTQRAARGYVWHHKSLKQRLGLSWQVMRTI